MAGKINKEIIEQLAGFNTGAMLHGIYHNSNDCNFMWLGQVTEAFNNPALSTST